MNPQLFLTAFLCFIMINVKAQNAYYDALFLTNKINRSTSGKIVIDDTVRKILNEYYPDKIPQSTNKKVIDSFFKKNPFFINSNDTSESIFLPLGIAGISDFNYASLVSKVGGLDVTSVADGLARFLIKRGKEELSIAFFQRLKKFLEDNVEAKTLFPATSEFLGNIASYRYSELLQSLREAFHNDLKNLIVNLNLLIDLPKYKELLKALPEIRVAIRSAKIVSDLSQADSSIHPANLIHRLAFLNEWHEIDINLESSWKLLDIISESVRKRNYDINASSVIEDSLRVIALDSASSHSDTIHLGGNFYRIDKSVIPKGSFKIDTIKFTKLKIDTVFNNEVAWIRFTDFHDNILRNSIALRIFLGLFYEKVENMSFRIGGNIVNVQKFMEDHVDDIYSIVDLVENFLVLANDVDQAVRDIRERKGSLSNDDYYTYIEKAINIVEYGFKVANTVSPGIASDRYIVMARNANNLYKNIYTKNYNAAIMNAYLILEEVLSNSKEAIAEKSKVFAGLDSSVIKKNFNDSKGSLEATKFFDGSEERSRTVERILRYGNLMASIVKSESPEEAEAAIESAALPAGSSSIKKNSVFNISLNAYIGGYYSNYTNDIDKIDGNNSKVGFTAPVGIAFNKGLGHFKNGSTRGSLGIYLTVIDVGGIAGYRLNDDSTALDQKITLNDIFAPGGYLVYGIGLPFFEYIPLSIGYGWQYGSKLYFKTETGTLAVSDESRWRNNWFLAIDIPLANFWTKNTKSRR